MEPPDSGYDSKVVRLHHKLYECMTKVVSCKCTETAMATVLPRHNMGREAFYCHVLHSTKLYGR